MPRPGWDCGGFVKLAILSQRMQGSSPQGAHRIFQKMTIADNKKAFFDYFIEERYEAGMALEGWEVKAIRA